MMVMRRRLRRRCQSLLLMRRRRSLRRRPRDCQGRSSEISWPSWTKLELQEVWEMLSVLEVMEVLAELDVLAKLIKLEELAELEVVEIQLSPLTLEVVAELELEDTSQFLFKFSGLTRRSEYFIPQPFLQSFLAKQRRSGGDILWSWVLLGGGGG